MDILNSDWLIYMLKKAGKTPQARMLSLFDILEDWTDAPGMNTQIKLNMTNNNTLQNYLSLEAAKAGAALPEMLAMQLYVMALSACNEKIQARQQDDRASTSHDQAIIHAKNAAQALIAAQTKQEFRISKTSAYALAASFLGVTFVAGTMFFFNQNHHARTPLIALANPTIQPTFNSSNTMANPEDTSALIAQIDQMRKGNCQLIEALQLPDSYKKVYFENIVLGQISTKPSDQKLVRELLQKVRCNYTPMLMENSKN